MDNYLQGLQQRPVQPTVPQMQQPPPVTIPQQGTPQMQQPQGPQQPTVGPAGIWRELARIIMGGDDGA